MNILSLETPRALEETIQAVQHGGVIAFPTDTVYGLGASLQFPDALSRIFDIKGRARDKSLPVLLSAIDRIPLVATMPDASMLTLLREFWPGALTVALPARADVPEHVVAADGTVGVRIPDHSLALTLCDRAGGALATTSANRSGAPPARSANDIADQMDGDIDIVLDGGMTPCGEASTVIRADNARITTIRGGSIDPGRIDDAWRRIVSSTSPR